MRPIDTRRQDNKTHSISKHVNRSDIGFNQNQDANANWHFLYCSIAADVCRAQSCEMMYFLIAKSYVFCAEI